MTEQSITIKSERYDFIEKISKRSNSHIYIVRDKNSKSRVVIKYLKLTDDVTTKATNFINEARIVAALEHPNIIPIHDIQMHPQGTPPYYTMKLVKGESLATIISKLKDGDIEYKSKYNRNTLLQIFLKVCDAISFAHSKNIINLDIEPSNIKIGKFGEVYVVEWGLSKYYKSSNANATNKTIQDLMYKEPLTNQAKGTLGYIPLEQIQLSLNDLDPKTDIFSLGAILYSIVTLEKPIIGNSEKEIIEKMQEDNFIIPPIQRTPKQEISITLSKIVMKAMHPNINKRYMTVGSLQQDILNFLHNKETIAYPDNISRKITRISSKYKNLRNIISIIVAFLIISFSYVYNQQQKILESWIPQVDFQMNSLKVITENFSLEKILTDRQYPIKNKSIQNSSFNIPNGHWLWIKKHHFDDSLRIVIDFSWSDKSKIDGFEVCFNTKKNKTKSISNLPAGYSIQIGGWKGQLNLLSINRNDAPPDMSNATACNINDTNTHQLIIERKNELIDIFIDGNKILSEIDPLPFLNGEYGGIGLRSWSDVLHIHNFKVFSRVLPIYSSPLVVGDAFYRVGLYDKAMREYLKLVGEHYDSNIREMALRKLIIITTKLNKKEFAEQLLNEFQRDFPDSLFNDKIVTNKIIIAWGKKDFKKVFELFNLIKNNLKKVLVAKKILNEPHSHLPPKVGQRLLETLALENVHFSLDIRGYGLTSLNPIRHLNLKILDCSNNKLESIKDIKKMPLQVLNIKDNKITDISYIENAPITTLTITNNPIKGIPTLKNKTLKVFNADYTQLESLEFLKNQPIEQLNISHSLIKTLKPLEHITTLTSFNLSWTDINDISPLKNVKLKKLHIGKNYLGEKSKIKDISLLDVSELEMFSCDDSNISNLNILENAYKLKQFRINNSEIENIKFFKKLHKNSFANISLFKCPINNISSLENINTEQLSLSELLITDLSPIINKKFITFPNLYSRSLPKEQLTSIYNNLLKYNYKYSEYMEIIITAFYDKDYSKLKSLAKVINNKKYLYIHCPMSYKMALSLASNTGGHLLTLETKDELENIKSLLKEHKTDIWLGLKENDKNQYMWLNNTPLNWDIGINENDKKYSSEKYFFITLINDIIVKFAEKKPAGRSCIIEWDK